MQRSSIPEELLRPRRDEAPRYPIDMVIGTLGQGDAPREAYEIAHNAASAFLAGNMTAPVFSPVSKVFVESCMSMLNAINPQFYRIGGGREEPDGSFSFLVRFVGREQGITGELFVRFEEHRPPPPEPGEEEDIPAEETIQPEPPPPAPIVSAQKTWLFEDLILEEARNREEENMDERHRFDLSPYERIY
ncbi:MAG: hypothetical protein FWF55_06945 [Treponema sp.]|nr:hypothetical protein [Treponema sp.]